MKSVVTDYIVAFAVACIAAFGGFLILYSELDDAPGGVLIGFFLILGAAALDVRTRRRASRT
jgi:hypothetical protein